MPDDPHPQAQIPTFGAVFSPELLTPQARETLTPGTGYDQLVPETNNASMGDRLSLAQQTGPIVKPTDQRAANCVMSALWLWHDFLDESHTLSQPIETPEGSYLHGIMHRREGDFSNAKYWFRRAGPLLIATALAGEVQEAVRDTPADRSVLALTLHGWSPDALVDLVEQVHNAPGDPRHAIAVAVQRIEWRLVVDHCIRLATT